MTRIHNVAVKSTGGADVNYVQYSPSTSSREYTEKLVEAFTGVFATGPWYEWKKCSVHGCNAHWGIEHREELESIQYLHCGEPVIEFWPNNSVLLDIYHEITAEASCWLAEQNEQVVGFCWGYPIRAPELSKKIGLDIEEAISLSFGSNVRIAYQDELGTLASHRGVGIARTLFERRLADFLKQGLEVGIVRTRALPEPSVTYLWFTEKLGYIELARYGGDDGRVILGQRLSDVKKLLSSG